MNVLVRVVIILFFARRRAFHMLRAWLGICIEGDRRYRPAEWLLWMQLQNNGVGVNGPGRRTDGRVLWYPDLSQDYVQSQMLLHDGPITLADEQAQRVAWRSKLGANHFTVGP
jgi:hypothetical protein